jgi:hypothetical protein
MYYTQLDFFCNQVQGLGARARRKPVSNQHEHATTMFITKTRRTRMIVENLRDLRAFVIPVRAPYCWIAPVVFRFGTYPTAMRVTSFIDGMSITDTSFVTALDT